MIRQAQPMGSEDAGLRAYYAQRKEWDRLCDPKGVIEFERTKEILQRAASCRAGGNRRHWRWAGALCIVAG
jgi:hypothetical protein